MNTTTATTTTDRTAALINFVLIDDDETVWGHGSTLEAAEADARDYRDGDLRGLSVYRCTPAASAAIVADGADAGRHLVFEGRDECWHRSEVEALSD